MLNDHIAFRTFNDARINTEVLAREFLNVGYEYKGSYYFEQKKLNAKHYEHKDFPDAPRVFISELIVEEFSPFLQETVKGLIDAIPSGLTGKSELVYAGNLWGTPLMKFTKCCARNRNMPPGFMFMASGPITLP